jgi:uncharacterized repeat protein (TIGR04042 family)
MPELYFDVRWPDGRTQRCYSPSTVVADHLAPGESYDVADFVARSRTALRIASERVRAKFGVACTAAEAQLAEIERIAAGYGSAPGAAVTVEWLYSPGGNVPGGSAR